MVEPSSRDAVSAHVASDVVADAGCSDCGASGEDFFDFLVPTAIWNYVYAGVEQTKYTIRRGLFSDQRAPRCEGEGGVLCLLCFDRRAKALGMEYRQRLVAFGFDCWMGGTYSETGGML